jgi:hypothetical protein
VGAVPSLKPKNSKTKCLVEEFLFVCLLRRFNDRTSFPICIQARSLSARSHVSLPTKGTGVDLLVTNSTNTQSISFQVKFSRDYLTTHFDAEFQKPLRACGWFTLASDKIKASSAHFWVLVLIGSKAHTRDYVVIRPRDLLKRLERIHGTARKFQVYLWITEKERCWETRGLTQSEQLEIAKNAFAGKARDFTVYLNNWEMVQAL